MTASQNRLDSPRAGQFGRESLTNKDKIDLKRNGSSNSGGNNTTLAVSPTMLQDHRTPQTDSPPRTLEEKKSVSREHIKLESLETLIWRTKAATEKSCVVIHYPYELFKSMEHVLGLVKSGDPEMKHAAFELRDRDQDHSKFYEHGSIVHLLAPPVKSQSKDFSYLKGATVIIPICYGSWSDLPYEQQQALLYQLQKKVVNSYLNQTWGVKKVILYLGRYSDILFRYSESARQKKELELRKQWKDLLTTKFAPKNPGNRHDTMHKVEMLERPDLLKWAECEIATKVFNFNLSLDNSRLLACVNLDADSTNYSKSMTTKQDIHISPSQKPVRTPSPPKDGNTHRLVAGLLGGAEPVPLPLPAPMIPIPQPNFLSLQEARLRNLSPEEQKKELAFIEFMGQLHGRYAAGYTAGITAAASTTAVAGNTTSAGVTPGYAKNNGRFTAFPARQPFLQTGGHSHSCSEEAEEERTKTMGGREDSQSPELKL